MRRSWVQLYAPFLVLAAVQAMFIAVAPSRGPKAQTVGAFAPGDSTSPGPSVGNDSGGAAPLSADGTTVATDPTGTAIGGGPSGATGSSGSSSATRPSGASSAGAATTANISHCKNGRQIDILINNNPNCTPKFSGDNGGATYQGVTKDTIKVIVFQATPNEQVNTILGAKGLAADQADVNAFYDAAFSYINKNYELYGRKILWELVVGDCPTTPPDYDKCNAAAQEVVKRKPALVVWITSLYASVFDIWAKAGIPSIGGSSFDVHYYTDRRPYRYDVAMDGTQAAHHIAEYYCQKMAKKKASHTGRIIHGQIGARGAVDRKLGLTVPEIEANVLTAKAVAAKVKACGGGDVPIFTYASDIERATEQTEATVAGLVAAKVTTVSCMCDPIAPVFLTQGMTHNGYYPEFLLPGLGLLDYDLLGQLYDPAQMQHAFGPSHLPQPVNLDDSDPARIWRATGHSGHPCKNNGCGLNWAYSNAAGIAIQAAGPNYNPLNLERGMLTLPRQGGWEPKKSALISLYNYGKGDYTGLGDVREVYWSSTAVTPTDGSNGAYLNVADGRRFELGTWPANNLDGIPVSAN